MLLLICIFLAIWCWLGRGPYFLRWPALLGIVALTSGHPLAAMLGEDLEPLAEPLLTLFFVILGLLLIFRGVFGGSRRRYNQYGSPEPWHRRHHRFGERRDRYDRW